MWADADIAGVAALIGDPARARMLSALMGGTALTATGLALEAEVAPSTASSHLARLTAGHILRVEKQGRHRYYRLDGEEVAELLEGLMGAAILQRLLALGWARRDPNSRVITFSAHGERSLAKEFG